MKFTVTSNSKVVAKNLKKKNKLMSQSVRRALLATAQFGINIIEDRTAKGKGYKGGAFKPYSDVYAAFRKNNGRSATPDLQFTGKMIGSITTKANNSQAVIFFTRAAEAKKAAMNNKSRPFFGFNRKEKRKLSQIFFRNLK